MAIDSRLADAFARLPDYLGSHVLVSITALAMGLGISLPLAIASRQRAGAARGPADASPAWCRPSPAWRCSRCSTRCCWRSPALSERLFGKGFSALGFLPSVLALALYSMLPVLRNTVIGLNGVDRGMLDAARALALKPRQILWLIELPLAMPVIMAGIRTSAVWVIGTATLSTPIGQTSLGNYIFAGLQTQNWVFVLFGCVAAAALALVVDQLLALMEHGVKAHSRVHDRRRRRRAWRWSCWRRCCRGSGRAQGDLRHRRQAVHRAIRVGGADRAAAGSAGPIRARPQRARLRRHLQCARCRRHRRLCRLFRHDLGQRNAPSDVKPRAEVLAEVARWLESDARHPPARPARLRERLCAGDAARAGRKARHPLDRRSGGACGRTVDRRRLRILRAPGMEGDSRAYGLHFRQQRTMQSDFMYQAAANGDVDVISAYTSDGRIAQYDLIVLDDPKHAIPPYDAILLLSPRRANDARLIAALQPLIGAIPVALMREANLRAAAAAPIRRRPRWRSGWGRKSKDK